jgi:hypothetical protein
MTCAALFALFACQPPATPGPVGPAGEKGTPKTRAPTKSRSLKPEAKAALPPKVVDAADGKAARKLFDDAVRAQLRGDALEYHAILAKLASSFPNTRHGRAASRRLGSSGFGIAGIGILSAVAIPAFLTYVRRAKTSEPKMNLRRIHDGAVAYYAMEHATRTGEILPRQFPVSVGPTPARTACEGGSSVKVIPAPGMWEAPTWRALNFAVADPFYYRYEFISDGKSFTARATGDLNCDGTLSTFERIGTIGVGGDVESGAGMFMQNELE